MTDSMNFGPEWLRNLSSEGTTAGGNAGGGGGGGGGVRYQLAEYRYGREEMLALYEKGLPAPGSLCAFSPLYSEIPLAPLALQPHTEEERQWQSRGGAPMGPSIRGARGGALAAERGGRVTRGRGGGAYQPYGRTVAGYETTGGGNGWGANGGGVEQTEWSPRKDFSYTRPAPGGGGVDNWRRSTRADEDDGWRTNSHPPRSAEKITDKWSRSSSWREGEDERVGGQQPDKSGRTWHDGQRERGGPAQRWTRDNEDHLPEWATEHLGEGGGTFDSSGAFHGSDDEQEGKGGTRKDHHLQKSISQQNITAPRAQQHTPLSTSKSAISLSKPPEPLANNKDVVKEILVNHVNDVTSMSMPTTKTKPAVVIEEKEVRKEPEVMRPPPPTELKSPPGHRTQELGKMVKSIQNQGNNLDESGNRADEDFDKFQEDLVLKLVVEEEPAKAAVQAAAPHVPHSNGVVVPPPPNMMPPPVQEKWYYQDPQGDLQGPFLSTEMAEWFKAGYFSAGLFVRRQCDERFYTLGDLVTLCGDNPFQATAPIAPLKHQQSHQQPQQEPAAPKVTEEMLQYHQMVQAQMAAAAAAAAAAALRTRSAFAQGEPWSSALGGLQQQRELLSQQFLVGQPQVRLPIPTEPFMPQPTSGNQLFQMLNHLNKMNTPPPPMAVEKPPVAVGQMDSLQALVHQMGGMQSMQQQQQQRPVQQPPVSLGGGVAAPPAIKHEALHVNNGIPGGGAASAMPGMPAGVQQSNSLIGGVPKQQMGKMDGDNNMNFLQFLQKPQMEQSIDLETLWRKNQYTSNQAAANPPPPQQSQPQQQWQQEQKPITMWDLPSPSTANSTSSPPDVQQIIIAKEPQSNKDKDESTMNNNNNNKEVAKEERKKREAEEKRLKREAEDKRRQEQRRLEQEREKRRKEEERVRRELEKAKREVEEKRAREAAEKRRLKEQRKAEAEEEAARRKAEEEELRRSEEREKERLAAAAEQLKRQQAEQARQSQKLARAAPWCQSVNSQELSLAEIQRAEKERKAAEQVALMQQQQQQQQQRLLQQQEQQHSPEKPAGGLHLSWANRPTRGNQQVKSLAEIQAEEQERLLKVKATEKAHAKEKETLSPPAARIWQGQTLTWNNDSSNIGGFWDEPQHKPQQQQHNKQAVSKVNAEPKSVKQQVNSVSKQQTVINKTAKVKVHKKEEHSTTNNNNGSTTDDFTEWCTKTLANMNTPVDIPTFVSFLFDIESALDVREYCRDYLGDRPATQQFAAQFLEKRRLFKPKATAHKDDMCSPAPAITPSAAQHNNNSNSSNDFQEVKGKGKKCKKSKMLKVDARILGFNVTAAQDRINVGDRDYGDTT